MRPTASVLSFALCLAAPSHGQISQTHPELCGDPYATVQLPIGVSGIVNRSIGTGKLTVKTQDSTKEVAIPWVVDEFQQVCPLADGKLVVFAPR